MSEVAAASQPVAAETSSPAKQQQAQGPKLEGAALQDALRTQLDFYFSKANLATDSFLLSQLAAHPKTGVPVAVICGFRKIQSLTDNKDLVREAMRQCVNLQLDEAADSVRSTIKHERNTLILRDIAPDADAAALRAVFENRPDGVEAPAKGHLVSLAADINDTWFVHFDSEAAATETCMDVQAHAFTDKAYTFNGKPIAARVKNETLNRGFYSGPPAPVVQPTHQGSSLLVGGPVSPKGQMPVYSNYNPYYGYPPYGMPPMGYNYGVPLVAPQQLQGGQQGAAQTGNPAAQTKAQQKAANQAAQAAQLAASQQKKAAKALKAQQAAGGVSPSAAGTSPAADGAKKPAKKTKAMKAAEAAAAVAAQQAATIGLAAPVQSPLVTSSVNLYGHTPRSYTREEMASIVEAFIASARANPSGPTAKRPAGFANCSDPEKAVLKEKPSTTFSILEPFPVIYPASPSPLLAAQPHHSNALPFLELGAGAMDAPYFSADQGFAATQRRKSQSGPSGKKNDKPAPASGASNPAAGNFTASAAAQAGVKAQQSRPASAATAAKSQPKIVAPPAVQPGTAAGAPAKPQSFAAAALASANAPQQPAQPKIVAPKAVQPKQAPAAAAAQPAAAGAAKPQGKKKAAPASGAAPAAAAPAAAAAPKQPTVNYASRVGAVSPAEAAAKAASIKQAKEAKERAEAEAKNPGAAAATAAAGAASPPAASTAAPATKSAAAPAASPAKADKPADKPAEKPAAAAAPTPGFSYAAMIKKAPAAAPAASVASPSASSPSPPAAAAATAAAKPAAAATAAAPAAATGNSSPTGGNGASAKSEAGNWRSQQA